MADRIDGPFGGYLGQVATLKAERDEARAAVERLRAERDWWWSTAVRLGAHPMAHARASRTSHAVTEHAARLTVHPTPEGGNDEPA